MEQEITLADAYDEAGDIKGRIKITPNGISLSFEGYEDYVGAENILIENQHGVPHVVVWSQKNREDPTHIISLEEAKKEEVEPCLCGRGECPECGD